MGKEEWRKEEVNEAYIDALTVEYTHLIHPADAGSCVVFGIEGATRYTSCRH